MAQELAKKGIQLRTEQIRDFIATYGVPKDPEAVQLLMSTPEVRKWA
jgi:hypothetical protein